MATYTNISKELKEYFSDHRIFQVLLPLDMVFIFGGVGLMAVNAVISIGGLLSAIAYYGFLLGLLLAYANFNQRYLYLGFFTFGGIKAFSVLKSALFYRYLDFYGLISLIIFGGLGYLVFKNTSTLIKMGTTQEDENK